MWALTISWIIPPEHQGLRGVMGIIFWRQQSSFFQQDRQRLFSISSCQEAWHAQQRPTFSVPSRFSTSLVPTTHVQLISPTVNTFFKHFNHRFPVLCDFCSGPWLLLWEHGPKKSKEGALSIRPFLPSRPCYCFFSFLVSFCVSVDLYLNNCSWIKNQWETHSIPVGGISSQKLWNFCTTIHHVPFLLNFPNTPDFFISKAWNIFSILLFLLDLGARYKHLGDVLM